MRNSRTQNLRRRTSPPLCVELLETRQVMSLLGFLPAATAPLVSALRQALPEPAETSVVSQPTATAKIDAGQLGVVLNSTVSVLGGSQASTPISSASTAVEGLLDHVLAPETPLTPDAANAAAQASPTNSDAPAPDVSLNIGGIQLGIGLTGASNAGAAPSASDHGDLPSAPSDTTNLPLDIQITLGAAESTPADGSTPTTDVVAITVGVIPQPNAVDSSNPAVGGLPALAAPAKSIPTPATSANAGTLFANLDNSRTPNVASAVGLLVNNPAATPLTLPSAAAFGVAPSAGLPVESLLRFSAPGGPQAPPATAFSGLLATANPPAPTTNSVVELDRFIPETSGLLADATPFELSAMDRALQQFLDQFDDLRDNVGAWFSAIGPTPWVLMTFAVAATVYEWLRRASTRLALWPKSYRRETLIGRREDERSGVFSASGTTNRLRKST